MKRFDSGSGCRGRSGEESFPGREIVRTDCAGLRARFKPSAARIQPSSRRGQPQRSAARRVALNLEALSSRRRHVRRGRWCAFEPGRPPRGAARRLRDRRRARELSGDWPLLLNVRIALGAVEFCEMNNVYTRRGASFEVESQSTVEQQAVNHSPDAPQQPCARRAAPLLVMSPTWHKFLGNRSP